jgi:acyl carrier protein
MTQEDALVQIQLIFQETLKRENILLTESSTANDVDGWNSLTHMIIISQIEERFAIRFNFRDVVKFKNVGDLCNALLIKMQ